MEREGRKDRAGAWQPSSRLMMAVASPARSATIAETFQSRGDRSSHRSQRESYVVGAILKVRGRESGGCRRLSKEKKKFADKKEKRIRLCGWSPH